MAPVASVSVPVALPDAPHPTAESLNIANFTVADAEDRLDPQSPSSSLTPAPSSSSSAAQTPDDIERRREEQVAKQEKQRVLGIVPNFNIAYDSDVPSLTPRQKISLALHTQTDPVAFAVVAFDAAYSQATDDFGPEFDSGPVVHGHPTTIRHEGYGQGWAGYGKRYGASYADNFDGQMLGNALLPILFKEDPRYFRRGTGTFTSRLLYAVSTTFWCKRDNGTWGPNYANVLGNLAAGGISNLYYPSTDRGATLTFERGFTVSLYGMLGGVSNEFLPDITRHFLHREVSGKKIDAGTTVPATAPSQQP